MYAVSSAIDYYFALILSNCCEASNSAIKVKCRCLYLHIPCFAIEQLIITSIIDEVINSYAAPNSTTIICLHNEQFR